MTHCAYCNEIIPTIERDGKIIVSTLYWSTKPSNFYCNVNCSFNHHIKLKEEQNNGISIES